MGYPRYLEKSEFCGLVLGAFLLGVAAHSFWPFVHADEVWITSGFFACILAAYAFRDKRWLFTSVVLASAMVFGFWRFNLSIPRAGEGVLPWMGKRVEYLGSISLQSGTDARPTVVVEVDEAAGHQVMAPGNRLTVRVKRPVEVGSKVRFSCVARTPGTFPSNLERRRSLARKGVWAECTATENLSLERPPDPLSPLVVLARWRTWLTARIAGILPSDEATLLSGILYGDQDLSAEQRDLFQRSGLMHIVAVSGSNVTIVVTVLLALVLALGCSRRQAFWGVSFGLLAFVGFVGFSASVLRAAVMGWLVILARQIGRLAWTDRLLLVAAAALNLQNPWLLAFDPGFALSFLATWGLLAWTPLFKEKFGFIPDVFASRETLATTAGATLMTAPYMAWAFGRMSLAGLLTNALALPLLPWAMLWGATAAVWGGWPGSMVLDLPALGLMRLIIRIAHLADYVPWLDLRVPRMEWALMVGCYGLIWYLWRNSKQDDETRNRKTAVDSYVQNGKMSDVADSLADGNRANDEAA